MEFRHTPETDLLTSSYIDKRISEEDQWTDED